MTSKEKVLARYSDAKSTRWMSGKWSIEQHRGSVVPIIGEGNTESEAWADAARRLK